MFEQSESQRRTLGIALSAVGLLFFATACQSTSEPTADEMREALESGVELAASFTPDLSLRARYLPPIGDTSQLVGEFANGLPLEVAVFRLTPDDSEATGTSLETFDTGTGDVVTRTGDTYRISWTALDTAVAERVRLEIRMVGSGDEPVCNDPDGECLGLLDVRIVQEGGKGRGGGDAEDLITVPSGNLLQAQFKLLAARTLEELATLSGQGGLDPEAGSCPTDEVALPSQGLQAVGAGLQAVGAGLQAVGAGLQAVGAGSGLFAAPLTGQASLAGRLVTPSDLGSIFVAFDRDLDDNAAKGAGTVLFVLDDFGGSFRLPAGLLEDDLDALMAGVDPDEDTLGYEYSHGALVFHQLRTLLETLLGKGKESKTNNPYYVEFGSKSPIRLQAVDARHAEGHIDTDVAAAALKDAMRSAYQAGYRRAVVNMSFAIVPCTVMEDFADADSVTFEDYVEALLAYNGVSGQTAQSLAVTVQEPVEDLDDALLDHIACPTFAEVQACGAGFQAIVNVAASGNYGLDFPLFPAAAPGVISVGSQRFSGVFVEGKSSFSNEAKVVAAGDVILLRADDENALAYIGTSFSAPIASLFLALDQRKASPTCAAGDPADPAGSPPQLASTDLGNLPLLPGLAPAGQAGDSAVPQYCNTSN